MYSASAIHLGVALLERNAIERARELIDSVDELALSRACHYATSARPTFDGLRRCAQPMASSYDV